ncbi:glycine--tRNA ligase subunit beta [Thermaerobacter composti]|uniref:Glycine--tRNA ligase beta subunit n=1 Tax=Thermaerobacter composti TaxID=554949 RepID=A0ABZ0QNC7_9FIRM|nr:glycine--tRNA ligase subunit beta [Thermaerobacter composti]WPD18906.1 glycine--tRNA ligase subunit beta [Thermaerobacter composti]
MEERLDLLVEVGCEEIPAADCAEARRQLAERAGTVLAEAGLPYELVRALGTPRRLTLVVKGLAARQASRESWVRGPARAVAYGPDGQPTRAALGFARAQGVAVDDLVVRETPQGEYVFARKVEEGRPAAAVLAETLPGILGGLEFRRTMRWGAGEHRFVRPVHWLVALLGEEVLPFAFAGVQAGRVSYGHRFLHPGPVELASASEEEYRRRLADAYVVVDPEERRERIVEQARAAAAAVGGEVEVDPELLAEVVDLVEYPTAFVGSFAEGMLELPRDVLVTTMKVHQRYFPVRRPGESRLLPHFVAVRNGDERHLDTVRRGNERVIGARLADARFFFQQDLRRRLADRVPDLERVSFLPDLGTLLDKTRRLERLVAWLAERLGLPAAEREHAVRAARLAKADLVTAMVYEFPELAGRMGREYALRDGEPPAVAEALAEQYLPRGGDDDELPSTWPGLLLATADRADTLAGCFAAGLEPTGSQDPYGLRRAAVGLLRLLAGDAARGAGARQHAGMQAVDPAGGQAPAGDPVPGSDPVRHAPSRDEPVASRGVPGTGRGGPDRTAAMGVGRGLVLPPGAAMPALDAVLDEALAGYRPPVAPPTVEVRFDPAAVRDRLLDFLAARLRVLLAEAGYAHDVIQAVLAVDRTDVAGVWARARAVTELLASPLAADVLTVHRRAANLAGRAEADAVDPALFREPEEQALHAAVEAAAGAVQEALAVRDYGAYFRAIAGLRPAVDAFLDRVLVMAEDPALRANRLALLKGVADLATQVAALGELAANP